jgi:predicted nuclease of predicted toxin-antitoxin system
VKLLFDQNLSHRLCRSLADLFPQSEQVKLLRLDRESDVTIWQHARSEGFTIVTLDGDFADIAALRGAPPKVIWLRCGNQPRDFVERLLRDHATTIAEFVANDSAACLELY